MKAKFLRDEEVTHPDLKSQADVIELRRQLDTEQITPQEWRARMFCKVKAGTVIDHPHAHRLVLMGMAVPHDKECHDRIKRLNVDPEVTAQGQDNVRRAQLTGDPNLDRDDDDQPDDEELDETTNEPIIVGNPVLEVPVPLEQQLPQDEQTLAGVTLKPSDSDKPASK